MYRDNRTCMLLEKNGTLSSSQRTRHINIRYFFMKDRIEKGAVSVAFCPTDDMIDDFFTKPLQGKKFIEFRDMILGLIPLRFPPEERVGTCEQEYNCDRKKTVRSRNNGFRTGKFGVENICNKTSVGEQEVKLD